MYISCLYIGDICIRSYVAFPRCFCQNREANVSALKQLSPAGLLKNVRMGFLKKEMVHQKSSCTTTSIYGVYLNSLDLLLCLHCLLLLYWWFFLKSFWQFVDAAPMCYVETKRFMSSALVHQSAYLECFWLYVMMLFQIHLRLLVPRDISTRWKCFGHESRHCWKNISRGMWWWLSSSLGSHNIFCGLHRFHFVAQFGCVVQACRHSPLFRSKGVAECRICQNCFDHACHIDMEYVTLGQQSASLSGFVVRFLVLFLRFPYRTIFFDRLVDWWYFNDFPHFESKSKWWSEDRERFFQPEETGQKSALQLVWKMSVKIRMEGVVFHELQVCDFVLNHCLI